MKLALAPVILTLATALNTGCGPGLTHQANAPTNVIEAMDAELAHALIGTATLTSAPMTSKPLDARPLPDSRMPVSQPVAEAPAPVQTWGVDPDLDPNYREEYGF